MTEIAPPSAPDTQLIEELARAAGVLLDAGAHVDAVHVLHVAMLNALRGSEAADLPAPYASAAAARRSHEKLTAEWRAQQGSPRPRGKLVELLERRPAWTSRAAFVVVGVALTLRYAWAVSDEANWPRQHPEGNWISRFYPNDHFEGFPLVRYDAGVKSDFSSGAPAKAMTKDGFSARWDTCLSVKRDVVIPLQLHSDDSSQLFLDGQLQFEVAPGPGLKSASVALRTGLRQLRVEFVERTGMALIELEGLELEGTDAYSFRRPLIDGTDVRCE